VKLRTTTRQRRHRLLALAVAATTIVLLYASAEGVSTASGRAASVSALLLNDGWVRLSAPRAGDGTGIRLRVGRSPRRIAYLEFLVRDARRPPRRVTLRLWSLSRSDGSGIDLRATRPAAWDESGLTSETAPRVGRIVRHHRRFEPGWIAFDLTRLVRGNGTYSLALTTVGRRTLSFVAGERGPRHAPRLIVDGSGARRVGSTTRRPGSPVLGDAAAARHVRPAREIRSDNVVANHVVPSKRELAAFRSASSQPYSNLVTGHFTGTTDEIVQWAAWKWGVDEDLMRAVAVQESDWHQNDVSDAGTSFGLFSVRTQLAQGDAGWPGTYPLAEKSTAFNADYYGRAFRSCFNGRESWLGGSYYPGDLWGCVGLWFSGGFHDRAARGYVRLVKKWLVQRSWARPGY
jgi:hypothetical protein